MNYQNLNNINRNKWHNNINSYNEYMTNYFIELL